MSVQTEQFKEGDRVRETYHNITGTIDSLRSSAGWTVQWDDGRRTRCLEIDMEKIND